MRTLYLLCFLACLHLLAASAFAGEVIEPADARGSEIRAAVKAFLTDLADGKEKEVRAAFAGDKAAEALLSKYIKSIAASQRFRKLAIAHFPDEERFASNSGVDEEIRGYIRAISVETIFLDGERASMSPGSGFLLGVDLKRVNAEWKIASPTALHELDEQELAEKLDIVTEGLTALADGIESGDLASVEAVMEAGRKKIGKPMETIAKKYPQPTPATQSSTPRTEKR